MGNQMAEGRIISCGVFDRFTERWPLAGDRLLSPGRDVFFAEGTAERNYRLPVGYKRAGDILIQNALADRSDSKNLVFPALFNYRHYIELALKGIIEKHGVFADVSFGTKNHKLPELWQLYVKIAKAFNNDCSDDATKAVAACIDEFDSLDPNSSAFRYTQKLDGNTVALPHDGLDLMQLHDVMNGIENFFECAAMDFAHKEDIAGENEVARHQNMITGS